MEANNNSSPSCPSCQSVRLVHFTSSGYPAFYTKDNPYIPPTGRERVVKFLRSFFDYFHRFGPMSAETKAQIAELDKRFERRQALEDGAIPDELHQDPPYFRKQGVPNPMKPDIEEIDTGCIEDGTEWRCKNCGHGWGETT